MVDDGFVGIPVRLGKMGRKGSPEALEQWRDLDRKRHEREEHRAEKEFRDRRKTKRAKKRAPAKRTPATTGKGG